MKLKDLVVTQESLRNEQQICAMIEFIKDGGKFSENTLEKFARDEDLGRVSPLMQLSLFEDGVYYLHDGHHRAISIFLAGREKLFLDEYEVTEWTYQDYLDVVFLHPPDPKSALEGPPWMGWVTPRACVRKKQPTPIR